MRIANLAGAAGLLVTVSIIGGTLIGSALAAPAADNANKATDAHGGLLLGGEAGKYCDVYLDTFASELGVSRDDLLPASKAAALAAIDAAVAAGDLDEDRATELKERIDGATDPGCGFVGRLGTAFVRGFGHGFVHADVLDAAADALGVGSAELIDQMAGGASLQEIAEDQGIAYDTVKAAVVAAVDADLEAAVKNGLAQERADAVHDKVAEWLDNGGEPRPHRFGGRFGAGDGPINIR